MPSAGDVIQNPVTGETITFLRTSEDTGGSLLEVELRLRPDAFLPAEHVHPSQEEAFTVLEGAVRFTSGPGRRSRATGRNAGRPPAAVRTAGARTATAPPGCASSSHRRGTQRASSTPFFALAREGKVHAKGLTNPIRMAQMGRSYDVYLGSVPVAMQRPVFAALDAVGRVLRYPRVPS